MDILDLYAQIEDIDELNTKLQDYRISVRRYDDERILFESDTYDTSKPLTISRLQIGGTIVDGLEGKVLCMPPMQHYYYEQLNRKKLADLYDRGLYDVIKARDGSIVNLYMFDSVLHMGTSHSVDVTNFTWYEETMGRLFYAVLPQEFIERTGMRFVGKNLTWNMNKDLCVTIGFHNSKMHMGLQKDEAWFISCIDRSTLKEYHDDVLDLLAKNDSITDNHVSLSELIGRCSKPSHINKEDNEFGYILESKDIDQTNEYSRVFIPSTYYSLLRKYCYRSDKHMDHERRFDRNILMDIMDGHISMSDAAIISDEFLARVTHITSVINMMVDEALELYDQPINELTNYDDFMKDIVISVKKNEVDLTTKNTEVLKKVLEDYIKDVNNVDYILERCTI